MSRTIAEENSMLGAYNWKIPRGNESETILQGYVKPQYTKPGSTISFHASSELDNCQFFLRIYRLGWYKGAGARQVHRSKTITVGNHGIWSKEAGWQGKENCGDAVNGMNWPRVYQLYIPEDWTSGSYIVKFETMDGRSYIHPFWISTVKESSAKIAVLGAVITSQSKNWWGGISATNVTDGDAFVSSRLYYPVGSEILSFERPYFNSRGGDALRWEYPLVRWIEKNNIEVAYHTDLELEINTNLLLNYKYVITTGPMRYWTENTEIAFKEFIQSGGNLVHLGSEAGQHIVKLRNHNGYEDGQIILQPVEGTPNVGERLKNKLYSATVSGSRSRSPWAGLTFNSNLDKIFEDSNYNGINIEGIAGLSWDKSIKSPEVQIVAKNKIKHRKWTYRVANAHFKKFKSGGTLFNAGVSSWSWGLEKFGNHGNVEVCKHLQEITLRLIGACDIRKIGESSASNHKSQHTNDYSLKEYNDILTENPRNFDALLGAGIMLWERANYDDAHTYFERALQIDSNSSVAVYRLARNHHKLQQFDEMVPHYEYLIAKHPDKTHYKLQYGDLLINLNQYTEAEKVITDFVNLRPDSAKGWASLAHCCRKMKKFDLAEKHCKKSLEIEPNRIQSLVHSARIAYDVGRFSFALERWNYILSLQPDNYTALMGVAQVYFIQKKYQIAQDLLKDMIKNDKHKNRIWPYLKLINITYNGLKDFHYTIELCKLLFSNVGSRVQNHKNLEHVPACHLAISLSKVGRHDEAKELLLRYLSENPDHNEYQLAISQVFRASGDFMQSFDYFFAMYQKSEYDLCGFKSTGENLEISVNHLHRNGGNNVNHGPLVSIIMTAFNGENFITTAIDSICNQTYRNIELIIVDDASQDNTFKLIQTLAEKDSRIRPIQLSKNSGTYAAKNHGLKQSKGKYVTFHDSDDWCHPDKIRIQVEQLEKNNKLIGSTTCYIRVDENSNIIYSGKGSLRHACISLMISRDKVVSKIGYFDSVRVSADSEFEERIHAVFGKDRLLHIDLPLIIASVRSESLSGGGKFALDWAGLSGPRLEYRQQFESYHDKIRNGEVNGYISFPLKEREFPAPEDIIW